MTVADSRVLYGQALQLGLQFAHDELVLNLLMGLELHKGAVQTLEQQLQVHVAREVSRLHLKRHGYQLCCTVLFYIYMLYR